MENQACLGEQPIIGEKSVFRIQLSRQPKPVVTLTPTCLRTADVSPRSSPLRNVSRGNIPNATCPASPTPQKVLLLLQYISNYIGKITQTRRGQCTHWNISRNCVSKCTRFHDSAYSYKKISRGACSRTPRGSSSPSATRDVSPNR